MISGRRTFELAGRWNGDHHDGVPIFVLTHRVEEGDIPSGSARFVTDVEECVREARAAAGDRAVLVHGAGAAQALLRAGLLDEMEIHLVQVLLGDGRRLFDGLERRRIELELVRRLDHRDVTHLRYQVVGFGAPSTAVNKVLSGLVFHVFAALAEFIRELIVDGTREGLAAARARGVRLGRPPAMTRELVRHTRDLLARPDNTVSSIARLLNVSRSTIYKLSLIHI